MSAPSIQNPHFVYYSIEKINDYVKKTLIDNLGAEKFTSLLERYTDIVGAVETSYTAQKLSEKLLKDFPYLLKTCKRSNKEGVVVYNHLLESDDAYKRAIFDVHSLKEAAFYLRKLILSSEITELPTPLTTKAIEIGQADKPNELVEFFQVLYTGTNEKVKNVQTEKVIDSVNDVMYATSHGRIKPGKHLSLALSIKSLTGSCKVIELINRLGHCSGYHIAENLETQFATEISARNRAMPGGMSNNQDLCTSLAWD